MTRIDEALRQSSAIPVDAPAAVAVDEPSPPATEHVKLEHYPLEQAAGIEHAAPPVAEPQRSTQPARSETAGEVPFVSTLAPGVSSNGAWAGKLVTSARMPELAIEQYRRLAAAIHDLQVKHGLKTVMVTSALPEDGKTLTAVNLALTLSESYARRVLLVDADLRHPSLHDVFKLPDSVGLGEFLRAELPEPRVVEISRTLHLLPAGRADQNPMAALTSARMKGLLEQAGTRFDWVLVDTPPLALLSDGQLLGALIKAAIFVIGAGSTPWPVAEKVIAELGRDCIVGTVLNGAREEAMPATSYYRRYDHGRDSSQARRSPHPAA